MIADKVHTLLVHYYGSSDKTQFDGYSDNESCLSLYLQRFDPANSDQSMNWKTEHGTGITIGDVV